MADVTDSHGVSLSSSQTSSINVGMVIEPNFNIKIKSITKNASSTSTVGYVMAMDGTILAQANFSSNVATFSTPPTLTAGTKYRVNADKAGASRTYRRGSVSSLYPIADTNVDWTGGDANGAEVSNYAYEIESVTTEVVAAFGKINIGDSWKDVSEVKINIGDSWKTVTDIKINIGDAWKSLA